MIFLNPIDSIDNIDFLKLKYILINIIGNHNTSLFTPKEKDLLIELFTKFNTTTNKIDKYISQFQVLYLIAHTLHKYNEDEINMPYSDFYSDFYTPNIISILSTHMIEAKKLLNRVVDSVFSDVKIRCRDIVEFHLVIFGIDAKLIKSDVINIFLNTLFLDTDPKDIDDLRSYLISIFRYLFFSYLKNKTSSLLTFEFDPFLIREDYMLSISTRYKIYEDGIRIAQIQDLCNKPDTYDKIISNYNKLKSEIITNELQKFYLYAVNKTTTTDNKISVLSAFDNENNLEYIKNSTPTIYRILRSIHVLSGESNVPESFKLQLYSSVKDTLTLEFSKKLSIEAAVNLSTNIAKKLTTSLTNGQFIDPLTLNVIDINTKTFIQQLIRFLENMLANVNR